MKLEPWTGIQPEAIATVAEVHAVRACINGEANGDQQKLAMNWIMAEAARVPDLGFVPGQQDQSDFNQGRRYAGILVRYCLTPWFLARATLRDQETEKKRQTK